MTKTRSILTLLLLVSFSLRGGNEPLPLKYHDLIRPVVKAFQNNDRDSIAKLVKYPLGRRYPIPAVQDEKELLNRFDEVFDSPFVKALAASSIERDWDAVGWRGIMFQRGALWVDYDGTILGVNHQSEAAKVLRDTLIEKDRSSLHSAIRKFENPVLVAKTKRFKIRIDEVRGGTYRYASWPAGRQISEKPSLVVERGRWVPDGSGGNHSFVFESGGFTYTLFVIVMGEENSPPGYLEVEKEGKSVVSEKVEVMTP